MVREQLSSVNCAEDNMKEITSAKCHRVGHIATSLVASKGRTDKPGEFELRGFLLDPYDYSTGQPFRRVME